MKGSSQAAESSELSTAAELPEIGSSAAVEQLIELQREVLSHIALGGGFQDALDRLCLLIEAMVPGGLASVMVKRVEDGLLYVQAGPSFPAAVVQKFCGLQPQEGYGSCGTAAGTGEPAYVCDVLSDYRWEQLRGVAVEFGVRSCWSYPIYSDAGEVAGTFAITSLRPLSPTPFHTRVLQDASYLAGIAIRHNAQQHALSRTEHRLRLWGEAFENTTEGVIITDQQGRILDVNRAFGEITGYGRREAQGQTSAFLRSGRHDESFYQSLWASLVETGKWQGEIWNRRKCGEIYPEWLSISRIDGDEAQAHYVGVFADLSSIKAVEQKLLHLAHHDPLTGLPNRLLFSARLEHALERSRRHGGQVAVVFVDLDRFKTINDTLGHAQGDELINAVAHRLREAAREEDTVARQGGDEFTLVLENLTETGQAGLVARKLLNAFKQPFRLDGRELFVTASIGISLYPRDGDDEDSLVKHADAAMYRAKERGRNNAVFYTPELSTAVAERFHLESDLRFALEGKQLRLYYQPQVDALSGRIVGAEALLRWEHPRQGMISPARFIPVAEESGMIDEIGYWVMRQACTQLHEWQQRGVVLKGMAVNLSGFQIMHQGLSERVGRILRETGIQPELLELEITESFAMTHVGDAFAELAALKALGVTLAIDDFGTGYSSLSHLKRMPIHTLKIDQSLVRDIPADPNDEAIARAVVALGHSLGLSVVAEGVETELQRDVLIATGCDYFQGYLYSRPVPPKEFARLPGLDSG